MTHVMSGPPALVIICTNRSSSPLASAFSVVEGPVGKDRTKYCTLLLLADNFTQTTVEVKDRDSEVLLTQSENKNVININALMPWTLELWQC